MCRLISGVCVLGKIALSYTQMSKMSKSSFSGIYKWGGVATCFQLAVERSPFTLLFYTLPTPTASRLAKIRITSK